MVLNLNFGFRQRPYFSSRELVQTSLHPSLTISQSYVIKIQDNEEMQLRLEYGLFLFGNEIFLLVTNNTQVN